MNYEVVVGRFCEEKKNVWKVEANKETSLTRTDAFYTYPNRMVFIARS